LSELREVLGVGIEDMVELQGILKEIDVNGDGQISYPEFKTMMIKIYKS